MGFNSAFRVLSTDNNEVPFTTLSSPDNLATGICVTPAVVF